ncbi:MAG: PorV/PorQ family protein [Flavobacteriales bacterium]|nr:PorV/PorQ family protein [Flavobacteriales bacterium]
MKKHINLNIKTALCAIALVALHFGPAQAGNPDRAGAAGASELLINPWARSAGWAGANMSGIRGLEALYLNVAGTAFTRNTELIFARTDWLKGSDIGISAFGLSQKVGEAGVLSIGVMSMSFGEIQRTTVQSPEGGIGFFEPAFMNLTIAYAKEFSRSIYGGLAVKVISENISQVGTQGIAFDAGIQYVTGLNKEAKDNLKFGISLKNVGPTMAFSGDGLSFRDVIGATAINMTVEQRSATFELPSSLNIGASYDFEIGGVDSADIPPVSRITAAFNFISNSFSRDQYALGVEYAYKSYLMIRAGYVFEQRSVNATFITGPTAGVTFELPLNKEKGTTFGIDYAYRDTNPFQGIHSMGVRFNL